MQAVSLRAVLALVSRALGATVVGEDQGEEQVRAGLDTLVAQLDRAQPEVGLRELWQGTMSAPDSGLREAFAAALKSTAAQHPDTESRLADLLRNQPTPPDDTHHDSESPTLSTAGPGDASPPPSHVHNTVTGDAQQYGPVVQAGRITGPVHLHSVHVHAAPRAAVPAAPEAIAPRQLPPITSHFTGRAEDMGLFDRLLAAPLPDAPLLLVLSGPAGVGKTSLATAWLRAIGEQACPDGQLYVDLRGDTLQGALPPTVALGLLLRSLGAASVPAGEAEQISLWRSMTAGRRLALLLDNALTAAQARPLIPGGTGSVVVVTSRQRLTGLLVDGARSHVLRPLGAEAGHALLSRVIGGERVAREPEAAQRVVDLCAGLPLAVSLASARLASRPRQPIRVLAEALAHESGPLTALHAEGVHPVRNALDASYDALGQGAALLYRRLGALPLLTYDSQLSAHISELTAHQSEEVLDELMEANLVEDDESGRYRFHDLVRVHARETAERLDSAESRTGTVRRAVDWHLAAASTAQRLLTPAQAVLPRTYAYPCEPEALPRFDGERQALAWLEGHRLELVACVRESVARGWHAGAWQLVDAMWPYFLNVRHYDLWIEAHEIGRDAARLDGSAPAFRQLLTSGAIGLSAAGKLDEALAWHEEALDAARSAGDVRDAGQSLLGLGACCYEAGRLDRAEEYLREARALWEECGYVRGVGLVLTLQGEVALADGDAPRAVARFEESRRTLASVDDAHNVARARAFLGRARVRAERDGAGLAELRGALGVFEESGAVHWQARALEMLGLSLTELGEPDAAAEHFGRAAALFDTTSPKDAARLRADPRFPRGGG
ncbi:putative regulator protein [Streptomyces albus]|uniref:Putative regulator protein n=1 Tax=Streptomyces albus (strain ATCC 21838 / DSM 41398 / FERM P-419 / JCM 4703 / NBRC 107858) TaxID=1081613 RepID=A0A0B5EYT4_STRA4|nr:putative regulator protein [Streptomyces albus]AOU78111.1 putative regulator protein [Streptomyces albus]AYN33866.1 putative regulator protein [Streptomyces albus]